MGIQSALTPLGNGMSFLCGRLSYTFGFHGICTAVDTACSSSLVAAHVAVLHMCDTSSSCVIGGANGMFLGYTTAMLGTIGALALSGRCKSFSQDADGFGRGEGYMAIGCARVSDSNQPSKAVCVAATSVNHDGNSSSLTAPHGPTQRSLLLGCRERSGFKHLEALSSHGTGTTLGFQQDSDESGLKGCRFLSFFFSIHYFQSSHLHCCKVSSPGTPRHYFSHFSKLLSV